MANALKWIAFPRLRPLTKGADAVVSRLFARIDVASLAYFRVVWGGALFAQVGIYLFTGRIRPSFIEPDFFFTYPGFHWVQPWPGNGMIIHFVVLAVAAIAITLGLLYRVSAIVFFLGWTYFFLIDKTSYQNHYYLLILLSFIAIFLPLNRAFSLDALLRPKIRSATAPAWALWWLRFQIGVPYFFGGVAKLNGDWLRGYPMRIWLLNRASYPVTGKFLGTWPAAYFFSYGGLLFDLLIVPLLLWRRTRLYALVVAVAFHLSNFYLFRLGIFPWLMIAATMTFLPPDWPRKVLSRLFRMADTVGEQDDAQVPSHLQPGQKVLVGFLAIWAVVQILLPLRHFLYPGNVSWTEEGHNFAWHMKLRDKNSGGIFYVTNRDTGETWALEPSSLLTYTQSNKMLSRPHMALLFAHHLADIARETGAENVEVRAEIWVTLNGRESRYLIDPEANLETQRYTLKPATWITESPESPPGSNVD